MASKVGDVVRERLIDELPADMVVPPALRLDVQTHARLRLHRGKKDRLKKLARKRAKREIQVGAHCRCR